MRPWSRLAVLLACASLCAACKKEDPPPSYPPNAAPAPGAYPAPGAPGTYPAPAAAPPPVTPVATAATPSVGPPALGFPCVSDQDLQCPFSHCLANRCGGCTGPAMCKPGAQCLPSVFGYACFPTPANVPVPVPVPVPSPAPTPANVPAPAPVTPTASNPADPLDAMRTRCVQRSNEFRATVGAPALTRRTDREACGDTEAQSDGATNTAHGAFGRCQESAQNECPGWPGPLDQVIDKCLAQMFAEGPGPFAGHGHYLNMTDPSYHGVSCGISTTTSGKIWIAQDFYR